MRQIIPLLTVCFLLLAVTLSPAETERKPEAGLTLGSILPVFVGAVPISPPALRFDDRASVHLAWFEMAGSVGTVKTVRIGEGSKAIMTPVQVNPETLSPDAIHQPPGLATARENRVFVTWSTPNRTPGTMFASDLRLATSQDGGETFEAPVQVNDDGQAIFHSFEDVLGGNGNDLYIAWLDPRGKDKSGAAAIFGCSRDQGRTIEKNLTIDPMACPCCRPMLGVAPNGDLWVAWRKTFDGNVRDVVVARSTDRGRTFSAPMRVHQDSWGSSPSALIAGLQLVSTDREGSMSVGIRRVRMNSHACTSRLRTIKGKPFPPLSLCILPPRLCLITSALPSIPMARSWRCGKRSPAFASGL